jgi:hypothetical protein
MLSFRFSRSYAPRKNAVQTRCVMDLLDVARLEGIPVKLVGMRHPA